MIFIGHLTAIKSKKKPWEVKEYGIVSESKQWIHKSDGIDSGENWMKAYNPWLYFQQLSLVT